jgi:hypothetical protein
MTVAEFVGSEAAPIAGFIFFVACLMLGFALLREISGR